MPKDAQGHGSNPRGMAKVSVTRPVDYTVHDIGPGGAKTLAASGVLAQGAGGQVVNAKDSTAQDRVAADALASGPKSASPPVHEAMQGPVGSLARGQNTTTPPSRGPAPWYDAPLNEPHSYNPSAVNTAIKQSERRGGKVSGKGRRMIHAILKGRG